MYIRMYMCLYVNTHLSVVASMISTDKKSQDNLFAQRDFDGAWQKTKQYIWDVKIRHITQHKYFMYIWQ